MLTTGRRATAGTRRDPGPTVVWSAPVSTRQRVRRRDRRARGIRGPLAPRAVPVSRSRATRFDEEVLGAWDLLVAARPELQYIEIAVSDVPEADRPSLVHYDPADAGLPARITVYRWALELRAGTPAQVRALVRDVMTEQAALFLGCAATDLDGRYPRV